MKVLANKLVEAHSYIDKSSNMTNIVDKLSSKEKLLVEHVVEKINEVILEDSDKQSEIVELSFENKIRLLAIIYNKSNDIILYPKEMRDEYIQRWAENLGLGDFAMRKCLVVGANKIDDIISTYND